LAKARTPEMEDIAGFRVPAANRNTESRGLWLEQPVQGGDRCVVVSIDGGGPAGGSQHSRSRAVVEDEVEALAGQRVLPELRRNGVELCQRNRVVIAASQCSTSKEREAKCGRSIGSETCKSRNHTNAWRSIRPFPLIHA
jgi:hypothetical protein